jgi:GAF domain-containing protein
LIIVIARVSTRGWRVVAEDFNGRTQAAMTELAGLLMATSSFEDLLQAVAALAGRTVPAAVTCGITLALDGHVISVASADRLAQLLDEQQYECDDGPCHEALRTHRVVITNDLATESRWDGYPARAVAHGVRSILSSPLLVGTRPIGVLNLYAEPAYAFDDDSLAVAAHSATLSAATMTAAMRHYDETTLTDNLRIALSSRSVIDQAMGIIIGTQHISATAAFDILRAASQKRNIPLREIAVELVAHTAPPLSGD